MKRAATAPARSEPPLLIENVLDRVFNFLPRLLDVAFCLIALPLQLQLRVLSDLTRSLFHLALEDLGLVVNLVSGSHSECLPFVSRWRKETT